MSDEIMDHTNVNLLKSKVTVSWENAYMVQNTCTVSSNAERLMVWIKGFQFSLTIQQIYVFDFT